MSAYTCSIFTDIGAMLIKGGVTCLLGAYIAAIVWPAIRHIGGPDP